MVIVINSTHNRSNKSNRRDYTGRPRDDWSVLTKNSFMSLYLLIKLLLLCFICFGLPLKLEYCKTANSSYSRLLIFPSVTTCTEPMWTVWPTRPVISVCALGDGRLASNSDNIPWVNSFGIPVC